MICRGLTGNASYHVRARDTEPGFGFNTAVELAMWATATGRTSFSALNLYTESRICYMHGCPCGFFSDPTRECRCTGAIIQRYLSKVSGPLLDRIDLHIEVPAVPYKELRGKDHGVTSAEMRARVEAARAIQQNRGFYNAHIPSRLLRNLCALDDAGERTLEMAVRRMGLSARAHDRILKVARTIADLGGAERVEAKHVAEGVQYRSLGRNYWT